MLRIKGSSSSPNATPSEQHCTDSARYEKDCLRERQPAVRDDTDHADRGDATSGHGLDGTGFGEQLVCCRQKSKGLAVGCRATARIDPDPNVMLKVEGDFAASGFKVPIPLVDAVDSLNPLASKTSLQALRYAIEERQIGVVGYLDLAIDLAICVRKSAPGHAHRFDPSKK
jgi:hypothetical protein